MKEMDTSWLHRPVYTVLMLVLASVAFAPFVSAHSPVVDASLSDWCVGAFSNTAPGGGRIEDSGGTLTCGTCSATTDLACVVNTDCPGAETCDLAAGKAEIAWWDNRTDGAVNDLGTVAMTWDNTNLYVAAELWVDPDPLSLPFGEIAIDFAPGGVNTWHDPFENMVNPGRCSTFTDRGCTTDADCHFCAESTEPFPSTRLRACGSGCNPDIPTDVCVVTQTCEGLGDTAKAGLGCDSWPCGSADYMLLFDFGFWLLGAENQNSVMLAQPSLPTDPNLWGAAGFPLVGFESPAWNPVFGCEPDFVGDGTECDFVAAVNPGASGGSGGPPGSVEVAIPWEAFGCTGCPGACDCPGFGPGVPFRFAMGISRGTTSLDFTPSGAHEDVMSEAVASTTTTSLDSCGGFGIVNTDCELADGSSDSFIPRTPILTHEIPAGGRNCGLRVAKNGGASVTLGWAGSCSAADTDFGVYEGTIGGNFTSHIPVPGMCSTLGAKTATFNASAGDRYFLVVPSDGSTEGSYGGDDITGERPVSATPCAAQILGECP